MAERDQKYLIVMTYDNSKQMRPVWQIIYGQTGKVIPGYERIGSRVLARMQLDILMAKDGQSEVED